MRLLLGESVLCWRSLDGAVILWAPVDFAAKNDWAAMTDWRSNARRCKPW